MSPKVACLWNNMMNTTGVRSTCSFSFVVVPWKRPYILTWFPLKKLDPLLPESKTNMNAGGRRFLLYLIKMLWLCYEDGSIMMACFVFHDCSLLGSHLYPWLDKTLWLFGPSTATRKLVNECAIHVLYDDYLNHIEGVDMWTTQWWRRWHGDKYDDWL